MQSHSTLRRRLDEQRALADREARHGADAGQPGLVAHLVAMGLRAARRAWSSAGRPRATYWRSSSQIGQCGGRRASVGELGAAGGADVAGHGRPSLPNQLAARQAMPTRMATAATARLDVSPSPSTRVPSSETMTIDASRPGATMVTGASVSATSTRM